MRVVVWFWLVVLLGVCGVGARVPADLDREIMRGKQEVYKGHVDVAEKIFAEAIRRFPQYPHGYFNQTFLKLLYFSQDMTNDTLREAVRLGVKQTLAIARAYQETHPDDADAAFHSGVAYGVYAIIAVLDRDYLGAYRYARRAKGYLEKTVELDSTYYDAYLGLGLFHYYVALLPGVVRFVADILGFEGDRDRGMRELVRTMQDGHYLAEEARFMYYFIRYFLEGYEELGANGFRRLIIEYPDNPVPHLVLGYHYRRTGYLEEAWSTFQNAPEYFREKLPQLIVVKYYNLAALAFEMNRFAEARRRFEQLDAMPIRKTRYYQAAIDFYRGLLADLSFNHSQAVSFYRRIPDHKKTRFWYNNKKMLEPYPPDIFLYEYIYCLHLFNWRKFHDAYNRLRQVVRRLDGGEEPANPNLRYLLRDLLAYSTVVIGNHEQGLAMYKELMSRLRRMPDDYQREWIKIHYARSLKIAGRYQQALEVLDDVDTNGDTYTKVVLEREKIVVKSAQKDEVPNYEE